MTEKEKEYAFDSLVLRFKDYQNRCFNIECIDRKYEKQESDIDARNYIKRRHERDLMRFIEILRDCFDEIKVKK